MIARCSSAIARACRGSIAAFDTLLRRGHGVFEFTADPACILRIALRRASAGIDLPGSIRIEAGEPLVEIHLWNERLPQMPHAGADLAWARRMHRAFAVSLHLLAKYLDLDLRLAGVRAIYGEPGFLVTADLDAGPGALARLGFEVQRTRAQAGRWGRLAEFWPSLYSYALLWTFNPGSLHGKSLLRMERCRLWMSRQALDERYLGSRSHE